MRRPALPLLLIGAFLAACGERVELGPGEFASEPPAQRIIDRKTLQRRGFALHTRADFRVTAKVLGKRRYRWDRLTPLIPWDFALGWGLLSDETHLRQTRVTQGARFMFWHLYDSPLPLRLVERSSANMHLIPATELIRRQLDEVPAGSIVTLRGQLVDVTLPDGRTVPTSLSRDDRGAGACEILLVADMAVLRPEL